MWWLKLKMRLNYFLKWRMEIWMILMLNMVYIIVDLICWFEIIFCLNFNYFYLIGLILMINFWYFGYGFRGVCDILKKF